MSEKPAATPEAVAENLARGGMPPDVPTAERISRAISPAIATFDLKSLRLPMAEEPSNWARRALEAQRGQ